MRTIVGGAEADVVPDAVVEPAAVELYYRLPLLAEFYRKLLQFDTGAGAKQVALIADFEGVFSGIIRFMFLKTQNESGEYSESEVRAIVREVNAVLAHFAQRQAEGTTAAALTAFVKSDYDAFTEANRRSLQLQDNLVNPRQVETNYAILPGEDEVEDRPLPSVYIPKGWEAPSAADPFKDRPDLEMKETLRVFRKKLDDVFATKRDMFDAAGSATKIRQAQGEIERATTPAARFKIVSALIRGEAASVDNSVSLVFHETVVVGLNTLSAIETMLRAFHQELKFMDPVMIEGVIMDAFFRRNARGVGPGDITDHATLVAVMNAMRSIGAVPVAGPIGSTDGTRLPSDHIADDLIMRNYMLGDAVTMGARSQIDANLRAVAALTGNAICTNATTAGVHHLAAATINAAGPQNWNRQPSQFTDEFIPADDAAAQAAMGVAPAAGVISQQTLGALRVVARLLTNYPEIMFRFIESLFAISCDGLVDVHVSKGGVRADFSKLQSLVEDIFADVKYHFELLRPSIPHAVAKRFSEVENKGSIGWVEKNLIDQFFRGRDYEDPTVIRTDSREGIENLISKVFKNLTRNTGVNFAAIANAASIQNAGDHAWDRATFDRLGGDAKLFGYEWYGATFARIGWYDALRADSGIDVNIVNAQILADGVDAFGGLVATARPERGALPLHPRARAAPNANTNIFNFYDSSDQTLAANSGSLMFNFNRLVARYLLTLIDMAAGKKIYLNLVNAFVNGVASGSVSDPSGFAHPDIMDATANRTFNRRGDPKSDSILLASIAWALQRIRGDSNPSTNVADHLVTTLTDVPLYIKEAMRANLPSFVRLFDLIAKKCDFVKQVMQKTNALSNRPNARTLSGAGANALMYEGAIGGGGNNYDPTNDLFPGGLKATCLEKLDAAGESAEAARVLRVRFAAIFDAIAGGALALSGAASETLKELGDSPIYLQTGEGSIEQYTMRFGKAPLMPFSLAL
ncbi:MAG: hypothetical protein EBU54_08175, partial [Mycobacteriaceae bacterium]|nr:hypothetical protein [Mycobacteriaceae bacterium]